MERRVRAPVARNTGGVGCGCCACCTCLNLSFLTTTPGLFKVAQLVLGSMCQSLMVSFGSGQASVLGMSYTTLLTANSASVSTVTLLLLSYILSEKSLSLVRSSIFETLFNGWAALSYLSGSTYLATAVNLYLYPLYLITLGFMAYPAMIGAYTIGFALSFLHGVDAYNCYKYFKGYR